MWIGEEEVVVPNKGVGRGVAGHVIIPLHNFFRVWYFQTNLNLDQVFELFYMIQLIFIYRDTGAPE